MSIRYQLEPDLSADEFIDVLHRSTLAERRPVHDRQRIETMLRQADLIATARNADGLLVGVARSLTDFSFCTYLSDLAVDAAFQRQGIGQRLIRETHEAAGVVTMLVLLAAPKAREYYPHIGMQFHDSCWIIPRPNNPSPVTPSDSAS
ncbi:GNAT family N-acetyltransferase [Tuwongella immobilis]|uniref:N-acetyltransferase domain-containing protein n=1 Tax=Tuwongella immobilis TaxID=692036 RepID=A0A6C2YK47_9BACT|nr:GNAT family N-acetyltransferase [Tuwongella immobilis]VIP01671.1 gcn5-related n-acetyltransferase : Putative acetyltransferase OS=Singulisphaera acidiphila (strain ATCC BAA-1392 / DSM 18658 / VKM B-2454 / MOB10) GN=Sinac_2423 PE=4 SV=1: Acetyltransf_7 [Tuwongella immobilis]VTR99101.1 gcn5-related n-acetyltransferase : Putative acetyltransferase OS=Singulisphaera acidiphila (strain ATCC BAA-1392 / DSM 18658 / VKM B-2454 / MOB10) GN=Sinac_2423 PE=4 SV=1: Acetyltransf_7 [Tuwongella immobilis]